MAWRSKYKLVKATPPVWLLWAALLSAGMLAVAHGYETFGHLPPCELCLHQREGYWTALAVGLVGYGVARWRVSLSSPILLLLALVFAGETVLAAYHAGVEWRWWPGPTSCTGTHTSLAALSRGMASLTSGAKIVMVRCDQAAWRIFGLSMAGWNALAALALTAVTLMAIQRRRRIR